jgi:hypothetical protein
MRRWVIADGLSKPGERGHGDLLRLRAVNLALDIARSAAGSRRAIGNRLQRLSQQYPLV